MASSPTFLHSLLLIAVLLFSASAIPVVPSDANNLNQFYQSLTLTGQITWDLTDLTTFCSETGITCDAEGYVTDIDLSGSSVEGPLDAALGGLTRLQTLNISSNAFSGTIPTELASLSNLISLDLSTNSLYGPIPTQFVSLSSLQNLVLNGNQLTGSIPAGLEDLSLQVLTLAEGNNLCPLVDYSSWASVYHDFPGSTACDACAPFTCRNRGTCSGDANSPFTCACPTGFTGSNCEACKPGRIGVNCDVLVDTCSSNPCQNGGSCFNGINDFLCVCRPGFNGTVCQNSISLCTASTCTHGQCVNHINSTSCVCDAGWSGTACETKLNSCDPNPCLNGGTCKDGEVATNFTCHCLHSFNGTTCNNSHVSVPLTSFTVLTHFEISNIDVQHANSSQATMSVFHSAIRLFVNHTFAVNLEAINITAIGKGTKVNFTINAINRTPSEDLVTDIKAFIKHADATSFRYLHQTLTPEYLLDPSADIILNATASTTKAVHPFKLYEDQAIGVAIAAVVLAILVFTSLVLINNRLCPAGGKNSKKK